MKQRPRIYYTDSQKALMRERWRRGESQQQIAQLFDRNHSSIQPALIEWHTDAHPAASLPDLGLSLAGLDIHHPDPERVSRLMASLALGAPGSVHAAPSGTAARLVARINTPRGLRILSAPA